MTFSRLALVGACLLLAACDYSDERAGQLTCPNVSPIAQANMQGTPSDPLHCGPQRQPILGVSQGNPNFAGPVVN